VLQQLFFLFVHFLGNSQPMVLSMVDLSAFFSLAETLLWDKTEDLIEQQQQQSSSQLLASAQVLLAQSLGLAVFGLFGHPTDFFLR
jgi:hypothetical protein